MLLGLELAFMNPTGHLFGGFAVMCGVIEYHDTFHARTVDQQRQVVRRALDRRGVVVLRNGTTDHDTGVLANACEYVVEDIATDVIEVDIDTFWTSPLQAIFHRLILVIDGIVETELVDEEVALFLATSDTNDTAAFDLGDLPN